MHLCTRSGDVDETCAPRCLQDGRRSLSTLQSAVIVNMELYKEDDPAVFKRYLDDFCKTYTDNTGAGDTVIFRVPSTLLREEEREAETLDWVVSYLTAK